MNEENDIKTVRTACPAHCGIDCCGILAHVKDGKIIKLEPAEFPNEKDKRICLRGLASLDITYHPDRLKHPLKRIGKRGEGKFEQITWEEAFTTIAEKFKAIADEFGWRSIGWCLGGPGAGTTKFGAYLRLASLTQSTRVSAWGYGDAGLPCGSRVIFGSQFPYIYLFGKFWQRKWPELLIVWGTNPAESAPLQTMRKILDAKENGTKVVVIDPRFTGTAVKADKFLGLKPGTDAALALGLLNVIFHNNYFDKEFIRQHTNGPYLVRKDTSKFLRGGDIGERKEKEYVIWKESSNEPKTVRRSTVKKAAILGSYEIEGIECQTAFQMLFDLAMGYPPHKVEEITGVSAHLIQQLAEKIGTTEKVTFLTYMGFTRTYHGDISLRGLATVASVCGHVATSFSSGYLPAVLNWDPFLEAKPDEPSFHRLGILNLYDAVINGNPYPIKAVFFAFINFLNQCVDSNKIIEEFFPKLDFIVDTELFMTPNAKYADLILPVCSFLEFSDFLPHPYPYLQLQQKVIEPLYESKSDVDIAAGIAQRLGYGEYFEGGEEAMIDIMTDHPSLKGINRETLKEEAKYLKALPEGSNFPLTFNTQSGKIELYAEQLVEDGQALPVYLKPIEAPINEDNPEYPLTFLQGHSRFRTHSMFANVDSLLKLNPEPVVFINPKDAEERNVADEDIVSVSSKRARTILKAKVTEEVKPGIVDIAEGWWIDQFKEGSVNHLTHDIKNPVQDKIYEPNMHMNDVAVEVKKYMEGSA
ncbi:MAG: putative dimethyl sulfoxide reductase catalytic subunit A [Promethearchaeota archaeon]|nr:MAG: putative dimethyl sulfoxide reductase catalytic subunit A [Candidatus Lokiarchaeota archaeon]